MPEPSAIVPTADGEFEYEPTAPYVLSQPDDEWCYAIVRTSDGEVLGTDGWQQMGVVEDATFTRDLRWIVPELNRQAEEIDRLRAALLDAIECVEDWAGYASDYFQEKHDLPGDLARLRAAHSGSPAPFEPSQPMADECIEPGDVKCPHTQVCPECWAPDNGSKQDPDDA